MRFVVFVLVSLAIHVAVLNFYFVQKESADKAEQVTIQIREEVFREAPPAPLVSKHEENEKARLPEQKQVIKTTPKTLIVDSQASEKTESASSGGKGIEIQIQKNAISVVPPHLEAPPKPDYPMSERKAGHEGSVFVSVRIGRDGSLLDAAIKKSSGYKALDRSALAAVKKCPFKPGLRDGIPFEGSLVVEVIFKLK